MSSHRGSPKPPLRSSNRHQPTCCRRGTSRSGRYRERNSFRCTACSSWLRSCPRTRHLPTRHRKCTLRLSTFRAPCSLGRHILCAANNHPPPSQFRMSKSRQLDNCLSASSRSGTRESRSQSRRSPARRRTVHRRNIRALSSPLDTVAYHKAPQSTTESKRSAAFPRCSSRGRSSC